MKRILCLISIGFISFSFIGCTNSEKDITLKNEQQEKISTETNKNDITKTDNNDIAKTDNNSDTKSNPKISENNKEKVMKENSDTTKIQESTKQIYKNKLDNIELGMKDLDKKFATGHTSDRNEAEAEVIKRWDDALNEIYDVLKQQLSAEDMNNLKNEEIKWISYRDDKAKEDSSASKGGSIYTYIYESSVAETTKKRCYELVDKYMK